MRFGIGHGPPKLVHQPRTGGGRAEALGVEDEADGVGIEAGEASWARPWPADGVVPGPPRARRGGRLGAVEGPWV